MYGHHFKLYLESEDMVMMRLLYSPRSRTRSSTDMVISKEEERKGTTRLLTTSVQKPYMK